MNTLSPLKIFHDSVAGIKTGYKSLYECDCSQLNRSLGFREQLQKIVLNDIKNLYPTTHKLVYASQGPGGFLFDFIVINTLIDAGYHDVEIVFIEPLYEKKLTILQAYLDFQTWYKELAQNYPHKIRISTSLFKTFKEYAQACDENSALRANVLITVDPDDKKRLPDFSSVHFRKKFLNIITTTLQAEGSFYYLYFQKIGDFDYRHLITGRWSSASAWQKKNLLRLQHLYGEHTIQEKISNHLFLDHHELIPCGNEKGCVQMGKKKIYSTVLEKLLENPLQDISA